MDRQLEVGLIVQVRSAGLGPIIGDSRGGSGPQAPCWRA
jgi:hypothetical protein